jgi:anti-anti-sigma factor
VHDLLYLGARSILIDLRHMDFIDSSGLGLFMLLGDRCSREGWELSLTHPPDRSAAIFRITGTGERLPFVGEPAAAAL